MQIESTDSAIKANKIEPETTEIIKDILYLFELINNKSRDYLKLLRNVTKEILKQHHQELQFNQF